VNQSLTAKGVPGAALGGSSSYLLVKIARELNLAFEDLLVDCHRVVIIERIDTREHLVREDAECPPVDRLSVAFVEKYFGR